MERICSGSSKQVSVDILFVPPPQVAANEKFSLEVELKAGQDLKLVTDYDFKGDNTCIACTYTTLPTSVKPGNQILMADGTV